MMHPHSRIGHKTHVGSREHQTDGKIVADLEVRQLLSWER